LKDFAALVSAFARRIFGGSVEVENLMRLTGGANMESWSFDYAGHGYVLRRSPSADMMAGRVYGHDVEAAVVRAAFMAGVKTPEIIAEVEALDHLGTGYMMRRVEAEVNPAKILASPPPSLLNDFARELAAIHVVPLDSLPALPEAGAASLLADLKARFLLFGGNRPVMALAIRWLEDHLPPPVDAVLLHGDFRMGNIMVDAGGLAAVLDWELAHLGDRHQDLAFGCINSWRFGYIDRPAFGIGQVDAFFAAYARESGHNVDAGRFRWWLVYATLWWGVCCLQMTDIWRSGADSGLERAVIGRRASETEVDLLMLLEEDAPIAEQNRQPEHRASMAVDVLESDSKPQSASKIQAKSEARCVGETSAAELLNAVASWIETDIKPHVQGRDRFMSAVALNALRIVKREAEAGVSIHDKLLSEELLSGRKSLATPNLLAQLKAQSLQKLAADQPKYSALAVAQQKWIQ
jgi:aminoglycoside phosphotransferase (APT) family kinase protein